MFNSLSVRGVIYDLDGTLVESSLNFGQLKQQIGCPLEQDLLAFVAQLNCQASQQRANHLIQQHEFEDAEKAGWLPGAQDLVRSLRAKAIPQAILTRNSSKAAELKVRRNQIPISRIVTREDAPPKPDPAGLLGIAAEWQIDVANILYIGDYVYDIEAANRAGMISCLYMPGDFVEYSLMADMVCTDYTRLKEMLG